MEWTQKNEGACFFILFVFTKLLWGNTCDKLMFSFSKK